MSFWSSSCDTEAACACVIPMRYSPGRSCDACAATMGRTRRRSRLRSTAGPNDRPIAYPTWGRTTGLVSSAGANRTQHHRPLRRTPLFDKTPNAARDRSGSTMPIVFAARDDDEPRARVAPPWWPCGRESHPSSSACVRLVGRFFSRFVPIVDDRCTRASERCERGWRQSKASLADSGLYARPLEQQQQHGPSSPLHAARSAVIGSLSYAGGPTRFARQQRLFGTGARPTVRLR